MRRVPGERPVVGDTASPLCGFLGPDEMKESEMARKRLGTTVGCGVTRRSFLADCGLGFTGLALGAMLARDGIVKADGPTSWLPPDGRPHFAPRAKSVIWLFMLGGTSHMESFDPKP